MRKLSSVLLLVLSMIFFTSCFDGGENEEIYPGNDPNFTIIENENEDFEDFVKKVEVFNIPIYATSDVEDEKLLHAANIMAQYLDNNEDGEIDNQQVVDKMIESNAFVVMWAKESDLNNMNPPDNAIGQDLGNEETSPQWHTNGQTGRFDAALEEILHIITHSGYSKVYPDIFGEYKGTALTNAMDVARGGYFQDIPEEYPASAWYTYYDNTCEYECMATEYLYWAFTSILGAQANRLDDIENEWKLNTKEKVMQYDNAVYQILINPEYKLPTVLPDGTYMR